METANLISNSVARTPQHDGALPPFPEGWYYVGMRKSILKEKLIEKTWLGKEIVIWCDESNRICVADAFCPHLGAHMGPAGGGIVRDGCLVCPFHGFEFDTSGQCVATPNAPPPRAAKLKVFETRELLGMVFAWRGAGRRPPQWELPQEPLTGADWSSLRAHTQRFRGHPQETTENSVDIEHLAYTHGYTNVDPNGWTIDEAYLKSCVSFTAVTKMMFLKVVSRISMVAHVHGLGYSFVEANEQPLGLDTRLWVLATPVDGHYIDLVLVSQVRKNPGSGHFFKGLGFLPPGLRLSMLNLFALKSLRHFVMQDVIIWERKRYQTPPRLCRADGPIGKFRRYCKQFYPAVQS